MRYTLVNSNDFELVASWWKHAGVNLRPQSFPINQTYLAVNEEGKPVMSAALYLMNCQDGAMIENIIGNPEANRDGALSFLIDKLTKVAKEIGYTRVFVFSSNSKVGSECMANGFTFSQQGLRVFFKGVA